ncbi:MAG: capsid protein [Genomoviridae sp.]|nr:MAG: capsid protein [Genomoviridae sp.]
MSRIKYVMAYRRSFKRKPAGRRRASRFVRRSGAKRRLPRKRGKFGGMTKRRVIDIVSKKKSDTMVGLNVTQSEGTRSYSVIMGNTYNTMLWCPTARYKAGYGGSSLAARDAPSAFWKGVSEKIHIEADTSDPWLWRRIVFEYEGGFNVESIPSEKYFATERDIDGILPVPGSGVDRTNPTGLAGIDRYNRAMEPLSSDELTFIWDVVFKGQRFIDWTDPTTAVADSKNLKIHSDKTRVMKSGNDSAIYNNFKVYHPLNKTMTYREDESGSLEITSALADKKSPLQDVFILDLFAQSSLAPGNLSFSTTATGYWHEK